MEPFLSENNALVQIYLCTIMKDAWVKEEFCRDLVLLEIIFVFLREVNKMWKKVNAFSALLGIDKERETTNIAEQFDDFSFRKQLLFFPQNPF